MSALRILILEDEPAAVAQLEHALRAWGPVEIVAVAATVRRAIELLRAGPEPSLIVADIRLADGSALAVFDEVKVGCPVVFATAYDTFVVEALERNAIDYLLKPIQPERVAAALDKYVRLGAHFAGVGALAASLGQHPERVLARKGAAFVAVPVAQVAWFTTEHKLTLLVDRGGARLVVDEPLADLEARLDPRRFFRLNRQILAQVDAVATFQSAGKGKLWVELAPPAKDEVLVSQDNAAAFKKWIAG